MKTPLTAIVLTSSLFLSTASPAKAGTEPDPIEARSAQREEINRTLTEMARQIDDATRQTGDIAALVAASVPRELEKIQSAFRRSVGAQSRPLVIRTTEFAANDHILLEEDMEIMTRVLEKSLNEKISRPGRAMPVASTSGRSLYLENHGALFMINVVFPLVPGQPESAAQQTTPKDSAWEEARRELYSPRVGSIMYTLASRPEYDESKVSALKDALVGALRSGSNIRGLKPDDFITICVLGPAAEAVQAASGNRQTVPAQEGRRAADASTQPVPTPRRATGAETVLTARVKKSDADAVASGSLSEEAFRSRITMTSYAPNRTPSGS